MFKTIATHSGQFHTDEVAALAVLFGINPTAVLFRTRNPAELERADLRVDVGSRYEPEHGWFDHHQPGGAGVRDNGVPYASSGLIWKHFGLEYLKRFDMPPRIDLNEVWKRLDRSLFQPIDLIDCGQLKEEKNNIPRFGLTRIISNLNMTNLEYEKNDDDGSDNNDQESNFWTAMHLMLIVLRREVMHAIARQAARSEVQKAILAANGSPIIQLQRSAPWKDVIQTEAPMGALFVVFPKDQTWKVQGIPETPGSVSTRRPFPAAWAGLSGHSLADVTGVDDAIFCHLNRHLAGARTSKGANDLAWLAIESAAA